MRTPDDQNYRGAVRVVRRLQEAGHDAVLAGGCVRDLLCGATPGDYDVATDARPGDVEALFADTRPVGRRFGVTLVVLDGHTYEVAAFRTESGYSDGRRPDAVAFCGIEEDARRRDFTINGMFLDPVEGRLLDVVGGRRDLEQGVLRAIGEPEERFGEDHLRLLRAVRFAARLGFRVEPVTRAAIRRMAPLLARVSPERIQRELRLLLTDRDPAAALRLMDSLGLLDVVFPELADMRGCEQPENYHPEGDVFVHTLLTVEKLGPHPDFELAMAALLHDAGKPEAARRSGAKLFPEHCQLGAAIARNVCRRLRLPTAETERIFWLVNRHLYFRDAFKMRPSTLKKAFAHPGFRQLAALHRADALASWGNLEIYDYVMAKRRELADDQVEPVPLLTGDDLIAMGYPPGPLFGRVLDAVRDAQLDGEVTTEEEARVLALRLAEEAAPS